MLVTGASSGLGRQIAICASNLGAGVIVSGRDGARLDETLVMLAPGEHAKAPLDLADPTDVGPWLSRVAQAGPVHALVHSAGVHLLKPFKAVTVPQYEDLMRINVTAGWALAHAFRQKAVRGPEATIVFVSSVMGLVGEQGLSAYCASKAALGGLVRALSLELARERIRVNCVAPGYVQSATGMAAQMKDQLTDAQFEALTQMHPLGLGRAEDVAHAVAFLISPAARWITGTTLVVDGGYTAR